MTVMLSTLDGLTIASEVMGEGQPVLLLHGWGCQIEHMRMVAERLVTGKHFSTGESEAYGWP